MSIFRDFSSYFINFIAGYLILYFLFKEEKPNSPWKKWNALEMTVYSSIISFFLYLINIVFAWIQKILIENKWSSLIDFETDDMSIYIILIIDIILLYLFHREWKRNNKRPLKSTFNKWLNREFGFLSGNAPILKDESSILPLIILIVVNVSFFIYSYSKIIKGLPHIGEVRVATNLILIFLIGSWIFMIIYRMVIRRITKYRINMYVSVWGEFISGIIVFIYLAMVASLMIISTVFLGISIIIFLIALSLTIFKESISYIEEKSISPIQFE